MKITPKEIVLEIIYRLENQERNIDIAQTCGVSLSTVERINECNSYTNLHQYKRNIRKESAPYKEQMIRKTVFNEYIEHSDYYELHIINTNNIEVFGKIDKDDYERVSQYKWTVAVHAHDIRIVANERTLHRIGLHQFLLSNNDVTKVIDHINRDPLDNRKSNLRVTTRSINSTNAKKRTENKSGIRGVYKREARPGIAKASWVCEWSDSTGRHSKNYSISKYGEKKLLG